MRMRNEGRKAKKKNHQKIKFYDLNRSETFAQEQSLKRIEITIHSKRLQFIRAGVNVKTIRTEIIYGIENELVMVVVLSKWLGFFFDREMNNENPNFE